jgi:hypothetical protein
MPRTKLPIQARAPKPPHTVTQILRWCDEFHKAHGRWPTSDDGTVAGTPEESWQAIDAALARGNRGLPGGTTLAKLLLERRDRPHWHLPPDLTITQVLRLADAHFRRTAAWPTSHDTAPIPKAPSGLTWAAVETALNRGTRGLPGGTSLANFLEKHGRSRNRIGVPHFTEEDILKWADEHHKRTGAWPKTDDGLIWGTKETWSAVETALFKGQRGWPGGDTLAKLLARRRGVRNRGDLPRLTVRQVKAWALAHKARTGNWPQGHDGAIPEAPGETWMSVQRALQSGGRGFPGGDSLARLLARECGRKNRSVVVPLTLKKIRAWVLMHHARTGIWPKAKSGQIAGTDETWSAVANALSKGTRGLPGGTTLPRFVLKCQKG